MGEAELIRIERPGPPEVVATLMPVVQQAKAFKVRNVDEHAEALERVKTLRAGEKRIAEHFEPTRKHLDAAKKELLAFRDGLVGPIAEARTIYDGKAQEYEHEEQRKAQEEERRLQELARKREEDRKLYEAIDAEEAGDKAGAEAILEEPVTVPTVRVAPAVAQVEGVSTRTLWSAEVHDVKACLKFMLERDEWAATLGRLKDVLETVLRPMATAQRDGLRIPGVRAVATQVRATRTA
jgi:hypothetical protein